MISLIPSAPTQFLMLLIVEVEQGLRAAKSAESDTPREGSYALMRGVASEGSPETLMLRFTLEGLPERRRAQVFVADSNLAEPKENFVLEFADSTYGSVFSEEFEFVRTENKPAVAAQGIGKFICEYLLTNTVVTEDVCYELHSRIYK